MRTAKNRLAFDELPDVIGPREIAQYLGCQLTVGYELVKRPGFPVIRIGRKYLVNKKSFSKWLIEQEIQKVAL